MARTSGRPSVAASDRGITSRVAATAMLGCNTQYSLSKREIDPKKRGYKPHIKEVMYTEEKNATDTDAMQECSGTFAPNACFEMAPSLSLQGAVVKSNYPSELPRLCLRFLRELARTASSVSMVGGSSNSRSSSSGTGSPNAVIARPRLCPPTAASRR